MKAFILFAVIVVAFAREQCGENEHYTGCGTDCPLTCDNYDNPPLICNRMCRIGCECDKGFVRSSDGRCVRPEQCPPRSPQPKCGENEHFNSCGTDCPLTCDNYANPPKFCNLMCRIGCQCDEGYVRSSDGRCVKPEQCPARFQEQECGANQHFTTCGTSCPLTCDNYSNPPKICNLRCNIGCACDEGFVLTRDGKCIRPFQCPQNVSKQCGENEHFNSCGTDCPLTCDNYANPPKFCNLMCRIGCECNEGYVRSSDGSCVRPEHCAAKAPECGTNQHFTTCGTSCPLTCDNYSNPPKICNLRCNIGCACDEGFVLTRDGKCIRPFQCPQNVSLPEVETCREEPDKGHCLGYFPMWYYDVERQECRKFIYGGCQGNGNRYESEERCYHRCHGVKPYPAPEPVPGSCTLPAETGVCRGRFPRYFYDVQTGKCQEFVYGGCGGNENNFETVEECQSTCAPQRAPQACLLEKVTGPCKARMIRYFFNKQSGQCEEFVYGGCSGNSNNFHTKDDCEAVCSN